MPKNSNSKNTYKETSININVLNAINKNNNTSNDNNASLNNSHGSRSIKTKHHQNIDSKFRDATKNFLVEPPKLNIIFATLKDAKDDSENPLGCMVNLYSIICSSYLIIVTLLLFSGLPIAMIAFGSAYIDKCSIEPKIPVWLIVFGVFALINTLIRLITSIYIRLRFKKNDRVIKYREPIYIFLITTTIGFFSFIWFCLGNIWVFAVRPEQQSDDINEVDTYCHQICYDFAFWSIISFWIVIGLILLFIISLLIYFGASLLFRLVFKSKVNLANSRSS